MNKLTMLGVLMGIRARPVPHNSSARKISPRFETGEHIFGQGSISSPSPAIANEDHLSIGSFAEIRLDLVCDYLIKQALS
jgi:hypothetical protein